MGEAYGTKWRCPYCDAVNDSQNAICQVCGDGIRPDMDSSPTNRYENSSSSVSDSFGQPNQASGLKGDPGRSSYSSGGTGASVKSEKRKRFGVWKSILAGLLTFLFVYAITYTATLHSQSAERESNFAVPTVSITPVETYSPSYYTPEPYQYTYTTPTPIPTLKPAPLSESTLYYYMSNLWAGKRYDDMTVNFFMNSDGTNGGIYYHWSDSGTYRYGFIVGSLSWSGDWVTISDDYCRFSRHNGGTQLKMWSTLGEHTLTVKQGSNGSIHLSGTVEEESFDMDLYAQNAEYRSSISEKLYSMIDAF